MTVFSELQHLEKVQSRLVRFSKYLDKQNGSYDDLYIKIASIIGSIEDVFTLDI